MVFNMENITLGQIALAVAFIVGLWTGIDTLVKKINSATEKALKEALKPTNEKIDALSKKIDTVDLNSTKNFIVTTIEDVEKGLTIDETTKQRLYEQIEHYYKLGGNSYLRDKLDNLKKNSLL